MYIKRDNGGTSRPNLHLPTRLRHNGHVSLFPTTKKSYFISEMFKFHKSYMHSFDINKPDDHHHLVSAMLNKKNQKAVPKLYFIEIIRS